MNAQVFNKETNFPSDMSGCLPGDPTQNTFDNMITDPSYYVLKADAGPKSVQNGQSDDAPHIEGAGHCLLF
jgi:hypothetical protein